MIEFVDINTGGFRCPRCRNISGRCCSISGLDGKPWYEASDYPALEAFTSTLEASVDVLREEFLAQVTTPMLLPYEEQVAGRFESIRRNDWGRSISGARAARSRRIAAAARAPRR